MNNFYPVAFSLLVSIGGCTNLDISPSKKNDSPALYADYAIKSNEERQQVTILLQFRKGGSEGAATALPPTARVQLDGEELKADSAHFSGVYYEVVQPAARFSGKHLITHISEDGQKQEQEFNFVPLQLARELPQKMSPTNYKLIFAEPGFANATVHLIITDTAFDNNDVNLKLPLNDNSIEITSAMWASLQPGPVVLEIFLEEVVPLPTFSSQGGKLSLEYALKREFILLPVKARSPLLPE